jgi:hypothetical protein
MKQPRDRRLCPCCHLLLFRVEEWGPDTTITLRCRRCKAIVTVSGTDTTYQTREEAGLTALQNSA